MIQLDRITLREIHLPLVEPFHTSTGSVAERRIALLELHDADGSSVWSECVAEATPKYAPETVDTCWQAIEKELAHRVLGATFAAPHEVDAALARDMDGHKMARAAIEMGTWALAATKRSQSLASLLASASALVTEHDVTPRMSVETGIVLGLSPSPETLAERAREAAADGYPRIKLKIEPGRDIAFVAAVRDALGSATALSVDANASYSAHHEADMRALTSLDDFGLAMIEQPLDPGDFTGHAALQNRLRTPICLDESISTVASVHQMLALRSGRVVNIKPGRVGGLTSAIAIHDVCARAGIPVWCGGMLECGIGRAYNVALASLPGFTEPGDLSPSRRYWAHDVVSPEWTMDSAGRVRVPLERAGIGVDVDTALIDELTVRSTTLRAR